ncbi:hypothetical protein AMECASPLE_026200 [Ameca splendens]|uniref:Uncharacterized protein n=1 Tax=Ameca splendens TaxID=208324 RepID=A0ABV0Y5E9_9TELE
MVYIIIQKAAVIYTLYKAFEARKVIAKEYQGSQATKFNRSLWKEKVWKKNMPKRHRIATALRGLLGEARSRAEGDTQRMDCRWSHCFKSNHIQTYPGREAQLSHVHLEV